MRIGLDFDGTIADWTRPMEAWLRDRLDARYDPAIGVREQLSDEDFMRMFEDILGSERTMAMEPVAGALDGMRRLGRQHELYIVTARNDHEATWSARWLEHHGVPVEDVVHTARGPKSQACRRLTLAVLLDDSVRVLEELHSTATLPVLLHTDYGIQRATPPSTLRVVHHWPQFEAICGEMSPVFGSRAR